MGEQLANIFKQYNDYLDAIFGISNLKLQSTLLEFRDNLRKGVDWSNEDIFYKIEAETFLKYLELYDKENKS
jgi:hypothetical protein